MILPGAVLVPGALLVYGWTAEYKTHWTAPNIGVCLIAASVMVGTLVRITILPFHLPGCRTSGYEQWLVPWPTFNQPSRLWSCNLFSRN